MATILNSFVDIEYALLLKSWTRSHFSQMLDAFQHTKAFVFIRFSSLSEYARGKKKHHHLSTPIEPILFLPPSRRFPFRVRDNFAALRKGGVGRYTGKAVLHYNIRIDYRTRVPNDPKQFHSGCSREEFALSRYSDAAAAGFLRLLQSTPVAHARLPKINDTTTNAK